MKPTAQELQASGLSEVARDVVTVHAMARWLQRICGAGDLTAEARQFFEITGEVYDDDILELAIQKYGMSKEEIAAEMLSVRVLKFIQVFGAGKLRLEDVTYVIDGGKIVSVYEGPGNASDARNKFSWKKRDKLVRKRVKKSRKARA